MFFQEQGRCSEWIPRGSKAVNWTLPYRKHNIYFTKSSQSVLGENLVPYPKGRKEEHMLGRHSRVFITTSSSLSLLSRLAVAPASLHHWKIEPDYVHMFCLCWERERKPFIYLWNAAWKLCNLVILEGVAVELCYFSHSFWKYLLMFPLFPKKSSPCSLVALELYNNAT